MGGDRRKTPIAITGMHRSGTSMITRALHDSGLHLIGSGAEELIDAAEDNPEGFWENKAIVTCNDALLEATGGSWDNPPTLAPQAVDDPRVAELAASTTAALTALSEHEPWGFKDPRTCLTAAYWLDLEPDLKFIICVRHPLEVALSLKRRNQNSYSLGLALWERYYASVLELVPPERRIVTHYDTFFVDPAGEVERLCAFAGLEAVPPRVRSDLRHHTVAVGLGDAGVSPSLRALYASLCRESGAPVVPEPPVDEGRVRRLILDGAVAARHAEQRQAAIDRLQEREDEFRRERAAMEAEYRRQLRDLEQKLEATRIESARQMEKFRVKTLEPLNAIADSTKRTLSKVETIDGRTRETAARLETVAREVAPGPLRRLARRAGGKAKRGGRRAVRESRRDAASIARGVSHHLPGAAQQQLRRARRVARLGAAQPVPTAKLVGRRLAPRAETTARAGAHRLPPPAQRALRTTWIRLRLARTAPIPTAKRAARRLPPPALDVVQRAWRRTSDMRRYGATRVARTEEKPKAAPTPKGPALRQWKDAYGRMVAATLPDGASWLVVAPGSPPEVRDVRRNRATTFPALRKGRPLVNDLAHIAHLEALRYAGHRYLVLPEGSRAWFRQQAELRAHVVGTYRTLVDEPGAGAVYDLGRPAAAGARSLRGEVMRLAGRSAHSPAVLDWTARGIAGELPGVTTFRPPAGHRLPYLDRSVDVVVVDGSHDSEEARRVAQLGVITVSDDGALELHEIGAAGTDETTSATAAPRVVVWSEVGADDLWSAALGERAAAAGASLRIGPIDQAALAELAEHDVAVVVEPHVLPLPGAIEAAVALALARPDSVVAGKVLRADGLLDSAGGSVFSNRSVALIAAGAENPSAPWHDYRRAVCWAPGLIAAAGAQWGRTPGPNDAFDRAFLREWCAAVWARGGSVVYEPAVAAVRVEGDGGEASAPLPVSSWQRVLDLRPERPGHLGDGEWRYLLAHDDVEACRR